MSKKISSEPYKGVRDFYPEDYATQKYIFSTWRKIAERVGYVEYEASILEPAELYKAKGADNEEIVKEQTYTFVDRGDREVTLRPEMTPTVARMVAAKRRELGFPLRFFSIPNLFRYERPQRGRLREHWQLNVDIFGSRSLAADAEIIAVAYGIMRAFGAENKDFEIRVGSRAVLNNLITELGLSEDSAKQLFSLLDRRTKISAEEFGQGLADLGVSADKISSNEPPEDIAKILQDFRDAGIDNIVYDPSIVRGFSYYTGMVFEVFDTHPENNRSLFGGGRYDNLTQMFDDEPLPGVGFGMGDVTIRDFLAVRNLLPPYTPPTKVYIAIPSPELATEANTFAGRYLRPQGVNVAIDFGERKLSDQIKTATKHKIPYLIVLGPDEFTSGNVKVRDLTSGEEKIFTKELLAEFFLNLGK
ncbi:histidine--tRNA ligase [Candidatus Parcubacteria bacterium]|nr:histidine--tRNA ligase [Candidatus Parcubacteria bacterium]